MWGVPASACQGCHSTELHHRMASFAPWRRQRLLFILLFVACVCHWHWPAVEFMYVAPEREMAAAARRHLLPLRTSGAAARGQKLSTRAVARPTDQVVPDAPQFGNEDEAVPVAQPPPVEAAPTGDVELAQQSAVSRANIARIGLGLGYAALFYSLATAESNPLYLSKVRDVAIGGAVPREGLKVLEVGIGSAPNLEYYPSGTKLVGLDASLPDRESRFGVEIRARQRGIKLYWVEGSVEKMPFDAGTFDAVVMTKVLCSVGDPAAALREVSRVLAPGGRFGYVEHVAADAGSFLEGQQIALDPFQQMVAGNCHLHRDTDDLIRHSVRGQTNGGESLFDHVDIAERYQVWQMWPITQQAAGVVTK